MFIPLAPLKDEFAGRRVLVTGGSRGIGAATAQRLIDGGAEVVTAGRTKSDETPSASTFVSGDVRTVAGAQQIVGHALEALGGLDILVNNAGAIQVHVGGSRAIPDEEWEDSLAINFLSAVRVTNAALPALQRSERGAIVNVATNSYRNPPAAGLHYGAAKAALVSYSKGLAGQLAPAGIRVNTVTPGSVDTTGGTKVLQEMVDAMGATIDQLTSTIPLGRRGDPRDLAELITFLVSDRAQWITGANYDIDGGA
ncbi:MAG TPA: oxidoreductase [Kribbella sp.]|uniref:oxidoreductase n=1 Tax=Kribbella sp. TaxID=1871183 RepID=UPI002D78168C|nr:oxidoreductase [Kribbella sp.]HET6294369.1 oxidoreductase [Kribbella sp.]